MEKNGVKAWLIKWDGTNPSDIPKDDVTAILNPRLLSSYVKKIVELLYVNTAK